jgi:predicted nucleic acid-binding protein
MFLDTSVLVKLLTPEPDSEHFAGLVDGQALSSSDLTQVEVFSALTAKERGGLITRDFRYKAWNVFETMVEDGQLCLLPVTGEAFRKARQFIDLNHPVVGLHALDAVQMAVCDIHQDFPLVSKDHRMLAAAARLGIPTT